MKSIIIGIDPGTTAAYAAIDLDMKLISIDSKKDYSMSDMISSIIYLGNPLLIGTDKKEIPTFIRSIKTKLGCSAVPTRYDTKKGEKKRIVRESGLLKFCSNVHEVDALASAIYAYREHLNLFNRVYERLKKMQKQNLYEKAITLILQENISLSKAISIIENPKLDIAKKFKDKRRKALTPPKKLTREEKQILVLKKQNLKLKQGD